MEGKKEGRKEGEKKKSEKVRLATYESHINLITKPNKDTTSITTDGKKRKTPTNKENTTNQ